MIPIGMPTPSLASVANGGYFDSRRHPEKCHQTKEVPYGHYILRTGQFANHDTFFCRVDKGDIILVHNIDIGARIWQFNLRQCNAVTGLN